MTFSIAVNDYGLELLSATPVPWQELVTPALLSEENLLADVLASLNAAELPQRRFREIARIAGLLVPSGSNRPGWLRIRISPPAMDLPRGHRSIFT